MQNKTKKYFCSLNCQYGNDCGFGPYSITINKDEWKYLCSCVLFSLGHPTGKEILQSCHSVNSKIL